MTEVAIAVRPGWETKRLDEVADILDNLRIPVNSKERDSRQGPVPYFGATGQVGWIDDHIFDEEIVLLGEDGAPFLDSTKQKAYVVRGKSWVNNHAHVLRAKEGIPSLYLKYWLDRLDYRPYVNGTTRLKLTQGEMRRIPIPLAPARERYEIVAEIEKQFSRLDEAVANLKRVKANLKHYKASVLNDAVEGRLVASDDQYGMVKLGSVANLVDPQPSHRTPPTHPDGVPYIGIGDVLDNGKVDLQSSRKVSPTVLNEHRARYTLRIGDFIFGKIGTLGRPTLLMPPYDYTLSANVVLVQADGVRLLPEYALIFMESPKLVNMVNRDAKATTQAAYGIKRMRDLNIELPTIELQRRIIAEVDRRLSLIRSVEAEVDSNLKRAQALRQATLHSAFHSKAPA